MTKLLIVVWLSLTLSFGEALPRSQVRLRVQVHAFGHWGDHWSVLGKSVFDRGWWCMRWIIDYEGVSRIKWIPRRLRLHFIIKIVLLIQYYWLRIDENWLLLMRLTVRLLMEVTLPNYLRLLYRRSCQRTIYPEGALQVWVCHVGELS